MVEFFEFEEGAQAGEERGYGAQAAGAAEVGGGEGGGVGEDEGLVGFVLRDCLGFFAVLLLRRRCGDDGACRGFRA